ncbi:MAG: hypothetical protein IT443_05685 [Phycisphaeraceae bacterium]|nr:hypothetical protein [Phycisphaeraceae bacterium]
MAYCVISILTLPFLNSLWLGELPVLALIQVPKVEPAHFAREKIVMPAIRALGLSGGSFSPDYIAARPYGLLLVYLVPAAAVVGYALICKKAGWTRKEKVVCAAALGLLVIDYVWTMIFARGPGVTVY